MTPLQLHRVHLWLIGLVLLGGVFAGAFTFRSSFLASVDSAALCGDGVMQQGEQCEKGRACQPGYFCAAPNCQCKAYPHCGNGLLESGEQCDTGYLCPYGHYCGTTCQCLPLPSYAPTGASSPAPVSSAAAVSSVQSISPQPASSSVSSSFSSSVFQEASSTGQTLSSSSSSVFSSSSVSSFSLCGNGILDPLEQCENNAHCAAGFACNNLCQCAKPHSSNSSLTDSSKCGNGILEPGERCDDGNALDADGCSRTCHGESGWVCYGTPSICAHLAFPSSSSVSSFILSGSLIASSSAIGLSGSGALAVASTGSALSSSSVSDGGFGQVSSLSSYGSDSSFSRSETSSVASSHTASSSPILYLLTPAAGFVGGILIGTFFYLRMRRKDAE